MLCKQSRLLCQAIKIPGRDGPNTRTFEGNEKRSGICPPYHHREGRKKKGICQVTSDGEAVEAIICLKAQAEVELLDKALVSKASRRRHRKAENCKD